MVWTIGLVSLALMLAVRTGSYGLFLAVFSLAALGSGAFHPQGVMHSARAAAAGRAATATAIFFLCGQIGLAGGPDPLRLSARALGPAGIYGLATIAIPVAVLMAIGLRGTSPAAASTSAPPLRPRPRRRGVTPTPSLAAAPSRDRDRGHVARVVALLAVIFTCRGWVTIGTAAFLPALFQAAG